MAKRNKKKEKNESINNANATTSVAAKEDKVTPRVNTGLVVYSNGVFREKFFGGEEDKIPYNTRIDFSQNDFKRSEHNQYLKNDNFANNYITYTTPKLNLKSNSEYQFENPFKMTSSVFDGMNRYKFIFTYAVSELLDTFINKDVDYSKLDKNGKPVNKLEANSYVTGKMINMAASQSMFNPLFAVQVCGMTENTPLLNISDGDKINAFVKIKGKDSDTEFSSIVNNTNPDITDCRIETLVNLSKVEQSKREVGMSLYRYADFMYCKNLGKVSNNYLITLRKFAHPIGDNIWAQYSSTISPDVGRLVTWIGDDNRLEDIMKYNYSASWKQLNAQIEEKQSEEDNEQRGIIGSFVNLANPGYLKQVKGGYAGSGNKILGWAAGKVDLPIVGQVFNNQGQYENAAWLGNYDNNRVYTPKDTVQDTHIYEGKLSFSQEFTLVFDYELRAYDNINPKSAFMDLIGNILQVTYRKGNFWGGARKINGATGNPQGWDKAEAFIDQKWDELGGFFSGLMTGNVNWGDVWGSISNAMGAAASMVSNAMDTAGAVAKNFTGNGNQASKDKGAKVVEKFKQSGLGDAFKGMLKNRLGRPAMYAFQSLLSGDDVGLWHVTIGNPRNPMMAMGNLIMTGATIQHYGPLGIDDFPTGLKVSVTLKHAKSRDATDISKMYTKGQNGLYMEFTQNKIENYFNVVDDKHGTKTVKSTDKEYYTYTTKDKDGNEHPGKGTQTTTTYEYPVISNGAIGYGAANMFGTGNIKSLANNFAETSTK